MQEPRVHLHQKNIKMKINQKQSKIRVCKVFAIFQDLVEQTWLDNEKARSTDRNWAYCRINGEWEAHFFLRSLFGVSTLSEKEKKEEEMHMQHFNISNSTRGMIQETRKRSSIEPEILQQMNNNWLVSWEILCRRWEVRFVWFIQKLELSLRPVFWLLSEVSDLYKYIEFSWLRPTMCRDTRTNSQSIFPFWP